MRITSTYGMLTNYYDRRVLNRILMVNITGIAPHTTTLRASYTVPSGSMAFIESIYIRARRDALATLHERPRLDVTYSPAAGGFIILLSAEVENNSYQHAVHREASNCGILLPGDKVEVYTADDSQFGHCAYLAMVKICEFK